MSETRQRSGEQWGELTGDAMDEEGHRPTPHEPVAGVKSWQKTNGQTSCSFEIDGEREASGWIDVDDDEVSPMNAAFAARKPCEWMASEQQRMSIRAFRDRIRADRANATAHAPSPA